MTCCVDCVGLADDGRAVVLITHKLREALSVADDVTVLRHGSISLCDDAALRVDEDAAHRSDARTAQTPSSRWRRDHRLPGKTVIVARDVSIVDARGCVADSKCNVRGPQRRDRWHRGGRRIRTPRVAPRTRRALAGCERNADAACVRWVRSR